MIRALAALAILAVACSGEQVDDVATGGGFDFALARFGPTTVLPLGDDDVFFTLATPCPESALKAFVDERAVEISHPPLNGFAFSPQPAANPDIVSTATVRITCDGPGAPAYRNTSAMRTLTFDPTIPRAPYVVAHGPTDLASVLSRGVVRFSRPMDPATITPQTFFIEDLAGTVRYDPERRMAIFTPDSQLNFFATYRVVLRGGPDGVRSLHTHEQLKTTIALEGHPLDPLADRWTFATRCEGCGNPDGDDAE